MLVSDIRLRFLFRWPVAPETRVLGVVDLRLFGIRAIRLCDSSNHHCHVSADLQSCDTVHQAGSYLATCHRELVLKYARMISS